MRSQRQFNAHAQPLGLGVDQFNVPSMALHVRGMVDLRQELIGNGVLGLQGGLYQFTQDYSFSSPSTAAAVVLGRSANGRIEWKDAQGRTLKALQEAEAEAGG